MPLSLSNKPVIAITMGDASGIGPEVTVKALGSSLINKRADYLVIGDGSSLKRVQKFTKKRLALHEISIDCIYSKSFSFKNNCINLLDLKNITNRQFGRNLGSSGLAAIEYIDRGIDLIKKNVASALVTGPVNKKSINLAGIKFSGHTEYLAKKSGTKSVAMMFVAKNLKVVLITTHMALNKVSSSITKKKIIGIVKLARKYLKKHFKIRNPKIGVLGLNPHAGEMGLMGLEEKEIISPAVKKLKKNLPSVTGPLPADTAFYDLYNKKYDILVSMYHDQGMIPVKMLARNKAVNLTLGLPYIRTSPVHGTAYDIAGKGKADPSSMITAINLAVQLI